MQSRNIKVRLNDESISQAISSLKEYKKTLKYKQAALMKELGEHGFEVMVREIDSYPMPYSKDDLINSVSYECTGKTVTIYNASEHALFVEFGTGIVAHVRRIHTIPSVITMMSIITVMMGGIIVMKENGSGQKVCHLDHSLMAHTRL